MIYLYKITLGETVTVVGEHDPALFKYFDCTRSSWRSPFDNNVVYQFEILEYVSYSRPFFFFSFSFKFNLSLVLMSTFVFFVRSLFSSIFRIVSNFLRFN